MAHNLNFNNGKHSFFSVREKPWHGLGTIVQEAPTSAEAIKLAGLEYEVVKEPIYLKDGVLVPDLFATVRQDTRKVFGTVGSRYTVLPNVDAFDFFDQIVGSKEAIFETAGALGDGETIFITAKLPSYMKVGKDDLIDQYLFLTTNHNGRKPVQAAFTPVRIVCNNTLNAALRNNSNKITVMHTEKMKDRLYSADKLMGIINLMKKELETVFNAMAKKPIVDEQLKQILLNTFATKQQLEILASKVTEKDIKSISKLETIVSDAYAYALSSDTQQTKTTKGTLFGAYNAVTGYIQNVKKVKKQEKHLVSVLEGTNFDYSQTAFNICKNLL